MRRPNILSACACALIISCTQAWASPGASPDYSAGVQAYKARQYNMALSRFASADRQCPANPTIHYYMGLCYQGMNQISLARAQYQWVARAGDPSLKAMAAAALANLSKYSTTSSGTQSAPAVTSAAPSVSGRLRIYDFYTDW